MIHISQSRFIHCISYFIFYFQLVNIAFGLTSFKWNRLSNINVSTVYSVHKMPLGKRSMHWASRSNQLHQLTQFTVTGHLEVSCYEQQAINMAFRWQQSLKGYKLELFDHEGKIEIEITENSKQARLRIQNKTYFAKSGELLFRNYVGISIPLDYFAYWLKGVPKSHIQQVSVCNRTRHLLTLHQGGWLVRYLRYHQILRKDLPTQLSMMKKDCYVRVFVTHWKL